VNNNSSSKEIAVTAFSLIELYFILYSLINMSEFQDLTVGVLALQGAFEEHQNHLESLGCKTVQVVYYVR